MLIKGLTSLKPVSNIIIVHTSGLSKSKPRVHARIPHAFRICAATHSCVVLWRRSIRKAARQSPSGPIDAAKDDRRTPLSMASMWLETMEKVGKRASWETKITSPR